MVSAIQGQAQPPAKGTAAQMEPLLKQRRDALDALVQILVANYQVGAVDFNRLSYALHRLGDAGLELAKGKDQRTAACQGQVALCRDVPKICQARFAAGTVSEIDVCVARAEQAKAEFQLSCEKAGSNPAQVESLRKERRLALEKAVEVRTRQFQVGIADFNSMALEKSQVAEAELELAKNKGARIAICQKQLELSRDIEKTWEVRYKSGLVNQTGPLAARALRLKAEIRLWREKEGDAQTQVEPLAKERRAALQKLVSMLVDHYRVGAVDFDCVSQAMAGLADAELEMATNKDSRIAVCQGQLELSRDVEKICEVKGLVD